VDFAGGQAKQGLPCAQNVGCLCRPDGRGTETEHLILSKPGHGEVLTKDFSFRGSLQTLRRARRRSRCARRTPGRGSVQKLLLDDTRLVDAVNRSRRIKYRFRANERQPPDDPSLVFWSIQDGLDPDTAAPLRTNNVRDLTRDKFLAVTIMVVRGERLTVADVLRYLANVAGAVHSGSPTTTKEMALASLASSIQVGGYTPEVRSLLAVARVVTKALQPIRRAIEEATRPA
jgi:hypothetical protein